LFVYFGSSNTAVVPLYWKKCVLAGQSRKPGINPESNTCPLEPEFDQDMYDPNICWCMYNVLAVRFEGKIAYRVAVSRVYYTAFNDASPERRTFWLG
jgi:hypothetical protein